MEIAAYKTLFIVLLVIMLTVGYTKDSISDQSILNRMSSDLRSPDVMTRVRASQSLANMGEEAVPILIEALEDDSYQARIAAAHALRDMRETAAAAVPALARNLAIADPETEGYPHKTPSTYGGSPALQVRWLAISALGHMNEKALPAVPELLDALQGKHEDALANLGPSPSTLKHSRYHEIRAGAAWVLQRIGPSAAKEYPSVVPVLADALSDEKTAVRLNAATALKAMGGYATPAVPALLDAMKHDDQFTRIYAALAFEGLGREAVPYISRLIDCHNSIHLDNLSRQKIRMVIEEVSGRKHDIGPERVKVAEEYSHPGLDRRDFMFVVHPFADASLYMDPDILVEETLKARMGNAFTYWADHHWYNVPPPTAEQMKSWDYGMVSYFFTEDIFNPKLQRDWGFATVEDYNLAMAQHILHSGKVLGKDRVLWAVGHEQNDTIHGWSFQPDGSTKNPTFSSKIDGYEFYRNWITTDARKRHWMNYGNTRPGKFFDGWNIESTETWGFIEKHNLDVSSVTMAGGGVSAALAHAAFDILPKLDMYWWESQVTGHSQQVGVAYLRGAARQFGRKWLLDTSPWSPVHGSPSWGYLNGKWEGGVTDEQQLRSWLYGYLSGADVVLQESSGERIFRIDPYPDGPSDKLHMTTTGRTAQEATKFFFELCPDRGEAYAPVGVLMEQMHGFDPNHIPRPWGFMERTAAEDEISGFWKAAFPGHSSRPDKSKMDPNDPRAAEHLLLTESRFGDCFDVLTDLASVEVLKRYPRLMTIGGIALDNGMLSKLQDYVESGGSLVVDVAHLPTDKRVWEEFLGVSFGESKESPGIGDGVRFSILQANPTDAVITVRDVNGDPVILRRTAGKGEIYLVATNRFLGRNREDSAGWLPFMVNFMADWIGPVWPVSVKTATGHEIPQVVLSKLDDGWLVAIGNHWSEPWSGDVSLQAGDARGTSVKDVWNQKSVASSWNSDTLSFRAEVPPFTLRTYRVTID